VHFDLPSVKANGVEADAEADAQTDNAASKRARGSILEYSELQANVLNRPVHMGACLQEQETKLHEHKENWKKMRREDINTYKRYEAR
jgi:hypothetical protein